MRCMPNKVFACAKVVLLLAGAAEGGSLGRKSFSSSDAELSSASELVKDLSPNLLVAAATAATSR